jgi:O-antigen/teichoic acid export membrane protein
MNTARRIVKNTTVLSVSQIVSYVLIFFYTIYIARFLGADGFGILSFALAISGVFSVFADLGLNILTVRDVSRDQSSETRYVGNGILIKLFLAIFSFGLIVLVVNLLGYPQETINVVYLVSLSTIITSFYGLFYSIFQAHEKMEYQSLSQIVNSIAMFSGVFVGIGLGLGVLGFSFVYLISSMITLFLAMFIYVWKYSFPPLELDLIFWKQTLKEAFPYGLSGIFVMIYYWIDSVMLSFIVGNEVVGWYNAAYRIIYIFLSFHTIFIISIFPVMSNLYKKSEESLKFAFEHSFKYLLIIGLPIAILTTFLSKNIILLLFGTDYLPSIIALQILIWTVVFMFLNGLCGNLLGSVNKQVIVTKITGIGVIVNVIMNLFLIPSFSLVGASFATVITEISLMPILLYIMWKEGYADIITLTKTSGKVLFSGFSILVFILLFSALNPFLLIFIALTLYLTILILTNTFDNEDKLIIRSIVKNIN